jgi:hypothetical protein
VQAIDADTKQPIPGAEVRISYPFAQPSHAPCNSSGTTESDGIARLRAAPHGDDCVLVEVNAPGHLRESKTLNAQAVQAIEPAHLFEAVDRRPASVVLEVYAEPRPTVELIVSAGYRGLVKVEVQIREDTPCAAGQRRFSYPVPSSGEVEVSGPPLLRHVASQDFCAHLSDGTPLSCQARDAEVGFWWVSGDGHFQTFLVGTRDQFDALANAEDHAEGGQKRGSHGGGGGRGRGRHSRGGTSQGGDSGS